MAARRRKETGRAMENRKKPELLIPAGSLEVLKTAVKMMKEAKKS